MSGHEGRTTREFTEFGPWIDAVTTVEELPRLYRDAGIHPAEHLIVLKVPRNIERRNARPDMDLYDYLIALDRRNLTVLHRREGTYDTVRVPLAQITAVEDSVRLLDGCLTVHALGFSPVRVPYNGSASAPVRQLVGLIRQWYQAGPVPAPAAPVLAEPVLGRGDTGLLADYRRLLEQEPKLRLLNVSERQVVVPLSWPNRLYRKVWPLVLQPSIMVADDREIQVVHRRDWFTAEGDDISLARTILPRARISLVTGRQHELYRGVHVVTVRSGTTRIRFPLTAGDFTAAVLGSGGSSQLPGGELG